jgi:hypothetical protein
LPRWRDFLSASPPALRVFRILGKTVVETALLEDLDRSLLDHLDRSLLDHPDGSLFDHRTAAGDESAPTPRRQVDPEQ